MLDLLRQRRSESSHRLEELVLQAAHLERMLGEEPLCIYITGSYGRLEAVARGEHASDLDLFFLYDGSDPDRDLPRTKWFPVAGRLIELAQDLGFPAFSGDAKFLEIQNVARMGLQLGSPLDDSLNAFTARMLLLLESRPVIKAELYEALMKRVIGFYFEDYDENAADFRPTYLLNDILRFWRTLTLNYEWRRRDRIAEARREGKDVEVAKRKTAEENVKLGTSRLSTCFSMVVPLALKAPPVTANHVLDLTRLSPTERWESIDDPRVPELLELYERFLRAAAEKQLAVLAAEEPSDARVDRRFGASSSKSCANGPTRRRCASSSSEG